MKKILSLKGHSGPIVSLSSSSDNLTPSDHPLLLSGSEDGNARLWDLRTHKSVKLFRSPENHSVNCVSFLPPSLPPSVLIASDCKLLYWDLRSTSVVNSAASSHTLFESREEINSIKPLSFAHSTKGNQEAVFVATADDSGSISLIEISQDLSALPSVSVIEAHKNNALAHCVAPMTPLSHRRSPLSSSLTLLSGGSDSRVIVTEWRESVEKSPKIATEAQMTSQDQLNPPFIHQIQWNPHLMLSSVAVGDGVVRLLSPDLCLVAEAKENGHSFMATCSLFLHSLSTSPSLLMTGAADQKLILWKLPPDISDPRKIQRRTSEWESLVAVAAAGLPLPFSSEKKKKSHTKKGKGKTVVKKPVKEKEPRGTPVSLPLESAVRIGEKVNDLAFLSVDTEVAVASTSSVVEIVRLF